MTKSYIAGIIIAIAIGFTLTLGIYVYTFYLFFLAIASILSLIIVLISLFRKTSEWKIILRYLSLGYITALTAFLTLEFLQFRNKERGDNVISALYDYRYQKGKFPHNLDELSQSIGDIKGNYVPDTSLASFKFYYRDLYGFPKVFSSKDSSWKR